MNQSSGRTQSLTQLIGALEMSGAIPRNPEAVFAEILESRINIARGIRERASDSQNHLRDFLIEESGRDATFPTILKNADRDFIGGSFGRHCKIWPLDDIDLYLPLDGAGLFYFMNGVKQSYRFLTDVGGTSNRILGLRWATNGVVSPDRVLAGFAAALVRHYPQSTVYVDSPAVCIRMTHGETEDAEGLGYDVVPCFSLQSTANDQPIYVIADGSGWKATNPRLDDACTEILHTNNGRVFRKVVKLVKHWNETKLSKTIDSFFIEMAIGRAFFARNSSGHYIRSIGEGLAIGMPTLQTAVDAGTIRPWLNVAEAIPAPKLTILGGSLSLGLAARHATLAWEAQARGQFREAHGHWFHLFGEPFRES